MEDFEIKIKKRRRDGSRGKNNSKFIFVLPKKLRRQCDLICLERGIEMAEYTRESLKKNNKNYQYILKNNQNLG